MSLGCLEKCLKVGKLTKICMKLTKIRALFAKNGCKRSKIFEDFDGNALFLRREKIGGREAAVKLYHLWWYKDGREIVRFLANLLSICARF
jgi:hypothetical protein